jgi:transposase
MEDLQNNFKSTFAKMSDSKINVNRLSKILQLGSIKNRVGSICSREMIQFSLVPAYYTSQWCNKCGLVDKENRSTQESFKCVGCGHEANADEYSSEKIAMYVNHRQLQNAFLMQDKTGWFKPKDRLTKSYIRNVLTNLYTT